MAGRGRGRGSNTSLTLEQLQSMGIGRGEANQGPNLGPPPLFPKLENKPLPLQMDAAMDYMLILKRQFIDFLHDSPSCVQPVTVKADVERYSDKYKVLSNEGKSVKESTYFWAYMPSELRPLQLRKGNAGKESRKRKLLRTVDIETRLKKLEQKELNEKDLVIKDEAVGAAEKNASGDENEQDSEKEEVEDPDEEMDDGTDYVDNYFDNGDGYEDEDENLDDGPVY